MKINIEEQIVSTRNEITLNLILFNVNQPIDANLKIRRNAVDIMLDYCKSDLQKSVSNY
jgi:hypothetical protein